MHKKIADARALLRDALREGDRPREELVALARGQGISSRTLDRASRGVLRNRYMIGRGSARKAMWSVRYRSELGPRVTGEPPSVPTPGRRTQHDDYDQDPLVARGATARRLVERLRQELLHRRKLSVEQIAWGLERDLRTASRILSAEHPRVPSLRDLAALHYTYGLDMNRLLLGSKRKKRLPPAVELEKMVQTFVATTIASMEGMALEYVREEIKRIGEGGELLPKLVKACWSEVTKE